MDIFNYRFNRGGICIVTLITFVAILLGSCAWRGDSMANVKERDYREFYAQYKTFTAEELNDMAEEYIKRQMPDSAMACYSIVASMDQTSERTEILLRRAKALNGMGYVLLYHKGDVLNAYDRFLHAREMAETNQLRSLLAPIYINIGNITVAKDRKEAGRYYAAALSEALASSDFRNANTAYSNLVNFAVDSHDMSCVSSEMEAFASRPVHPTQPLDTYISSIHSGAVAFAKGEYREAARFFSEAADSVDTPLSSIRFRLQAMGNQVESLLLASDTIQALAVMSDIDSIADSCGIADIRLSIYRRSADIYRSRGDRLAASESQNRYYRLTDSLFSFSHGYELMNVENNFNLNAMSLQVKQLERVSRSRQRVLALSVAIILVITVVALIIWLQKRKVDRLLANLYEKNRQLMEKPSVCIKDVSVPSDMPASGRAEDESPDSTVTGTSDIRSDSDDMAKEAILISHVMETSERIFNVGFNVAELAEMTGLREKVVSQTINSYWGMNFNAYLNGFRMREAARRLEDSFYGHLTIEALAESIGFRNRSHFASLFRSSTGMSPAEYRRAAALAKIRNGGNVNEMFTGKT